MKTKLTLFVAGLAAAFFYGCSTPSLTTLQKEDIIGVYHFTDNQKKFQYSFLQNGTVMRHFNGKATTPAAWKIEGNEIHVEYDNGSHHFLRVNPNSTLEQIAGMNPGGKRVEFSGRGWTAKKAQ